MPTAPRLVAAICLALLAFFVSKLIEGLMPDRTAFGTFTTVNMIIGALCGWIVIGRRVGRGVSAAIGNGITGMAAMVLWALLLHSGDEMVRQALRRRFDGPMEAFTAIFQISVEYGSFIIAPQVAVTLLVGGIVAGIVAEKTSWHWK